jgi:hypothetical protein
VKAVRHQFGDLYDAIFEAAAGTSENAQAESGAESIANQMKVLVSLSFWYDLLFHVNVVSKERQSDTVDVSVALSLFEKLLHWLRKCRETGFEQVLVGASELADE